MNTEMVNSLCHGFPSSHILPQYCAVIGKSCIPATLSAFGATELLLQCRHSVDLWRYQYLKANLTRFRGSLILQGCFTLFSCLWNSWFCCHGHTFTCTPMELKPSMIKLGRWLQIPTVDNKLYFHYWETNLSSLLLLVLLFVVAVHFKHIL